MGVIAERYAEIMRRSPPLLDLREWLLIFDSLNGCWLIEPAALVAQSVPHEVADACRLNGADAKWEVPDADELVQTLAALPFAGLVAVVDAAERFWALDVQPTPGAEPTETDPFAPWRVPVRGIVGRLADDPPAAASLPPRPMAGDAA